MIYKHVKLQINPHIYSPTAVFKAPNLGDPRPATGSQPLLAGNPLVLQPGLLPVVISFNAPGWRRAGD
jgi:hypothetical protein